MKKFIAFALITCSGLSLASEPLLLDASCKIRCLVEVVQIHTFQTSAVKRVLTLPTTHPALRLGQGFMRHLEQQRALGALGDQVHAQRSISGGKWRSSKSSPLAHH